MIREMFTRPCNPFALAVVIAIIAACSREPGRATARRIEELIRDNQLQEAMQTANAYVRDHPESSDFQRLRVLIALKAEQFDLAATALKALPPGDRVLTQALTYRDAGVRSGAARFIAEQSIAIDSRTVIRGLSDSAPEVRRYSAREAGVRRERAAVKPLFRLLHDDNWFVRAEAATALGRIGDPHAAGWLAHILGDSDGFVRYSAATALREIACAENRKVLLTFFHRAQGEPQLIVALALAKLSEPSVLEKLTSAVTNSDVDLRRRVAEALGGYDLSATTNALALLSHDSDPNVREQAEHSLSKAIR